MPVKLQSVPMRTIFQTLEQVGNFELVEISGDDLLLKPPSEWPVVDCLIAFYSQGYPLAKVTEYVRLVRPVVLNDVELQYVLRDRGLVYEKLAAAGIPVARNFVVDHEVDEIEEHEDYIVFEGEKLMKPFIEKPINADDHNNFVYYPSNAGGGCKKLFRKLANRSSEYYAEISHIRRTGKFVYEEFLPTLGTDIKVYTVGPMYAHAEARKSPTLDGRVQRTLNGKEERYPVLLTNEEKWIAFMVVRVFKQTVCGFDILRTTSGKAVVCDVNGWSFVKGNPKYYDDCANLITSMFAHALRNRRIAPRFTNQLRAHSQSNMTAAADAGTLRARLHRTATPTLPVKAVARRIDAANHVRRGSDEAVEGAPSGPAAAASAETVATLPDGTASPTTVSAFVEDERLRFDSLAKSGARPLLGRGTTGRVADPPPPTRPYPTCVLDEITREDLATLGYPNRKSHAAEEEEEDEERLAGSSVDSAGGEGGELRPSACPGGETGELQTIIVVMRHGDRSPKQKMKFTSRSPLVLEFFHKRRTNSRNGAVKLKSKQDLLQFQQLASEVQKTDLSSEEVVCYQRIASLLNTEDVEITRKVQLVESPQENGVLVIVKWGGDLTSKGLTTSESLGHHLRESLYPGEKDGLLRLHSTFRHDFKMYTSDEGRCQLTAAAFTKGFLDLDGELTPILVQMVCRDDSSQDLFLEGEYSQTVRSCKQILQQIVNSDLPPEEVCQKYFQPRFRLVKCPLCSPDDAYTLSYADARGSVPMSEPHPACQEESDLFDQGRRTDESGGLAGGRALSYSVEPPEDAEPTLTPAAVAVWQSLLEAYHLTAVKIGSFRKRLERVQAAIEKLIEMIEQCLADISVPPEDVMSAELRRTQKRLTGIKTRWTLLRNCWYKAGVYDATKIPEIYDNARFDVLHSHSFLHYANAHSVIFDVYHLTEVLGPLVSAMEFGITPDDRVEIGKKTVPALLLKIYDDILYQHARQNSGLDPTLDPSLLGGVGLTMKEEEHIILQKDEARRMGIKSPWRKVRSRYYAASASHVMSLLNVLTYGQFISQSRYHSRSPSDNTTTSALGSADQAAAAGGARACQNIPPLYITSGDAPYLSHISIRMWRPWSLGAAKNASLRDFSVELCWNAEPIKNSIRCTAADLANVLKHGFSKKLSPTSPPVAAKVPS